MNCSWLWWFLLLILLVILVTWYWTVCCAVPQPISRRFNVNLDGGQVVLPVITQANGQGYVVLNSGQNKVDYNITVNNIHQVTSATLRRGAAGNNGPVVRNLGFQNIGAQQWRLQGSWTNQDSQQPLTSEDVNDLLNGRLYILVTSTYYHDGEVRGQIA
jgi:hypothetical protein